MKYEGKLYGKHAGKYIPLKMTASEVDEIITERNKYLRHREEGKANGHKVALERDKLQAAIRDMVKAKGRYNTQKAMEYLISLLPENHKPNVKLTGSSQTTTQTK